MTVPHDYSPDGPVQAAPYEGYCQPRTRQEPFAAPPARCPHGRLRRAHYRVAGVVG